jgi:hypothetical protein
VNGEVLQLGTTANLIFGAAELIAWLSRTITVDLSSHCLARRPGTWSLRLRWLPRRRVSFVG